jgi:hypothetical protein
LELAKEAAAQKILEATTKPVFKCTIFEDNKGTVEMANVPKMRPRTKHLNVKYHFFRQYVEDGTLSILHIPGEHQMADIFTKPLEEESFIKHRTNLTNWQCEVPNSSERGSVGFYESRGTHGTRTGRLRDLQHPPD